MRRRNKHCGMILFALCLCMFMTGCARHAIQEDGILENLPQIDPEDGVTREVNVDLYYRLTDEAYLVNVNRNITVRPNERTEYAIIRTLIAGIPPLANNVSPVFAQGTSIVDVVLDGAILYVTLSEEFLDTSTFDEARIAAAKLLDPEKPLHITQEEYNAIAQAAQEEMYLARRLGVMSIVNTICGYESSIRVQVLVETGGLKGKRLTREELGMETVAGSDSSLIEPMGFDVNLVAAPREIVSCVLSRMKLGEYEKAYPLFAESGRGGAQRPIYTVFEEELSSMGSVENFEITSVDMSGGINNVIVHANISFRTKEGDLRRIGNAGIALVREGDLHKVEYNPFKRLFEEVKAS